MLGTRATTKLQIVHTDLLGPMHIPSTNGSKYAIGFVDSCTRYAKVYFMKTKDECLKRFQEFTVDVGIPNIIVTDGAKEYLSEAFKDFCCEKGIRRETSAPYTPQENGKIERIWGTTMGMVRCLIKKANMPKRFWAEALDTAFYVKARCIHSAVKKTPYEAMFGSKPDMENIRIFGCKVYVHEESIKRKKLDSKAKPGVFCGYGLNSKTYHVYVTRPDGHMQSLWSRNVVFDEKTFYYDSAVNHNDEEDNNMIFKEHTEETDEMDEEIHIESTDVYEDNNEEAEHVITGGDDTNLLGDNITATNNTIQQNITDNLHTIQSTNSGRSTSERRPPAWTEDYVPNEY